MGIGSSADIYDKLVACQRCVDAKFAALAATPAPAPAAAPHWVKEGPDPSTRTTGSAASGAAAAAPPASTTPARRPTTRLLYTPPSPRD